MRLAGAAAIFCIALGGCGSEPIWQAREVPRAGEDAAASSSPQSSRDADGAAEMAEPTPAPAPAVIPRRKRAPLLVAGIAAYDDGKYAEAAKALRGALATRLDREDEVAAHKYLAFIECSTRRRTQCRDEFRKALRIDPSFDLEPAEAGHPVWGPVFRSVKGKR